MKGLPPSGGEMVVEPVVGTAYMTYFDLEMLQWSGKDLPLGYTFGYSLNYKDIYEPTVMLTNFFSDRAMMNTTLPMSKHPDNIVRIYGYVQSAVGVTVSKYFDIKVLPPSDEERAAIQAAMMAEAMKSDASTSLNLLLDVLAVVPDDADKEVLNGILTMIEDMEDSLPQTSEVMAMKASVVGQVAEKGLKTDRAMDYMSRMLNDSLDSGYIGGDTLGPADVAQSLMAGLDSMTPGESPDTSGTRRLRRLEENGTWYEHFDDEVDGWKYIAKRTRPGEHE